MIKLDIKYSVEYEVSRIKDAIDRIKHFREKGYKLRFPESFSTENENFKQEEYIKKTVLGEYNETNYIEPENFIKDNLKKINTILEKFFTETNIEPKKDYSIYLTRYGVGGSYNFPNKIIINIQACKGEKLVRSIVHEIIHLSIEDLIQKYNVGHWEKERVVDLIFDKIAPKLNTIQKLPIETEKIDKIFEEKYPNIEEILKSLKD